MHSSVAHGFARNFDAFSSIFYSASSRAVAHKDWLDQDYARRNCTLMRLTHWHVFRTPLFFQIEACLDTFAVSSSNSIHSRFLAFCIQSIVAVSKLCSGSDSAHSIGCANERKHDVLEEILVRNRCKKKEADSERGQFCCFGQTKAWRAAHLYQDTGRKSIRC